MVYSITHYEASNDLVRSIEFFFTLRKVFFPNHKSG